MRRVVVVVLCAVVTCAVACRGTSPERDEQPADVGSALTDVGDVHDMVHDDTPSVDPGGHDEAAIPDTSVASMGDVFDVEDEALNASDGGMDEMSLCDEVAAFVPVFDEVLRTWSAQDDLAQWPSGGLIAVGSSTIRRWEGFAYAFRGYLPLQRGFGGAQLGEVAYYATALVTRHQPHGVIVFAGTNDVAAGVSAEVVVKRLRCLRARIAADHATQIFFVGITPTPARWAQWGEASAVNNAARALAVDDPAMHYVDIPAKFLETGSPPAEALFVDDRLHLSEAGYALWEQTLSAVVERVLAPQGSFLPEQSALNAGERVLIDLGPDNDGDGEQTPSPDYLGQHWNNWHSHEGGAAVLPGERLSHLKTTDGRPTRLELVISGGFRANGWSNGGHRWPDAAKLGPLAVGSATGDFFYTEGDDMPGALFLRGLDPSRTYRLTLYAGREEATRRVTRYRVIGGDDVQEALLHTSGVGSGADGGQVNDDDLVVFTRVKPDRWGHIFVDVAIAEGAYGYLSLLELVAGEEG